LIYALSIVIKHRQGDPYGNPKPGESAAEKIHAAFQEILNGKMEFSEMARLLSDDPKARDSGGVLGWIDPRSLPPEAWELRVGEMTPPIETRIGWCLILRRG
jgi:parvulin-like peptidyl-prolyl isomerase